MFSNILILLFSLLKMVLLANTEYSNGRSIFRVLSEVVGNYVLRPSQNLFTDFCFLTLNPITLKNQIEF